MYANSKLSEDTVQPSLAEKQIETVTHSENKMVPETKNCVEQSRQHS